MRVVVALGGNALLRRGEPFDLATQRRNAARAAQSLAPLLNGNEIIVTHGNGPQIGLLALQAALNGGASPVPLDVLGAESEGQIGYLLERELANICPGRSFATLLTMVEVDPADPAFGDPTKPIGPVYDAGEWSGVAAAHGWHGVADGGGMRRVVPSPKPLAIVELAAIGHLLGGGFVPICAGGGGVPVVRGAKGRLQGVEAVIDKDRTTACLAAALEADILLLLTDVDAVYEAWGSADARAIDAIAPDKLQALDLPAGTMGPKAEAASWFARSTGNPAVIGNLDAAEDLIRGVAGTRITVPPV